VDTWQHDVDAAVAFYTELLGWQAEDTMPPGIPGRHFVCRLRGRDVAAIASRPEGAPSETVWNTYIWVDSVDEAVAKAIDAGGMIVTQPFDSLDGGRMALLSDPARAGRHLGRARGRWRRRQRTPRPRAPRPDPGPSRHTGSVSSVTRCASVTSLRRAGHSTRPLGSSRPLSLSLPPS
jgi:predicted enzyme related to lactoylglutathione lyase